MIKEMIKVIIRILNWIFRKYKRVNYKSKGRTGAIKDIEDKRDYETHSVGFSLKEVDISNYVKEVKTQGPISSCVAFVICSMIELQLNMKDKNRFMPLSERYNYYYGRIKSNMFPKDIGMYPREAIKAAKNGIAPEYLCQYSYLDKNEKPSMIAKSIANIYGKTINKYYRVFSIESMKEQLSMGLPVLVSLPIYSYWSNNGSGNIRKPKKEDRYIGHHALLIVGYFNNYFICLNSWGKTWGDKGFCNLPMDYEMQDKWVVEIK